jgi:hypothetical protein
MGKCLECQDDVKGRRDKKFCDDVCRNAYNNRVNGKTTNYMRVVKRRLSKNRNLLESLNPHGKGKTSLAKLNSMGFDFNHFTSIYETKKGNRYYFVYEQGYLILPDESVALVVQSEYLKEKLL